MNPAAGAVQAQTGYGAAAQTAAAYGVQQPAAAAYGAGQNAGYTGQQAGAGYGTQAGSAYGGTTAQGARGFVGGMSGVRGAYPGQAAASDFDAMGQAQGFGGVYGAQQAAATAAFAQQTPRSTYGPTAQAAAAPGSGSAAGFGQAAGRMGQVRSCDRAHLRLRQPSLARGGACVPCTGAVPANKLCRHHMSSFLQECTARKVHTQGAAQRGSHNVHKTLHRCVTVRQAGSSGMHSVGGGAMRMVLEGCRTSSPLQRMPGATGCLLTAPGLVLRSLAADYLRSSRRRAPWARPGSLGPTGCRRRACPATERASRAQQAALVVAAALRGPLQARALAASQAPASLLAATGALR